MQVEGSRSGDGERKVTRKQKAEGKDAVAEAEYAAKTLKSEEEKSSGKPKAKGKTSDAEAELEHATKKPKTEEKTKEAELAPKNDEAKEKGKSEDESGQDNVRSTEEIKAEFERFCKATREHLSIQQMREILEANGQDSSGSDDAVVPRCQDILFYGPLDNCPVCGASIEVTDASYTCKGAYSPWSSCIYKTTYPPRIDEPLKLPNSIKDSNVADLLRKHQDVKDRPQPMSQSTEKLFKGLLICLSGRLRRIHQYWKSKIERHGGNVVNSVTAATCLVMSSAERERGGSSKLAEALERGIPIVREEWLSDSLEIQKTPPLDAYDVASDLAVSGRHIPLNLQDEGAEALETIVAELKVFGKRSVHKDTKLQDRGGQILEKDGILYNCAFSACDCWHWDGINEFCILQLITLPESQHVYLYCKSGKIGDQLGRDERLDERENVDDAIKEFCRLFEEQTGNEFEPWEREKKIEKKKHKLYPIDMDDGVDARYGGLGLRQLGVAAAHSKLEPKVANFMKVLCSQEIYRYAMMEMGVDFLELPLGMVTDFQLKTCQDFILEFVEKLLSIEETGAMREALWADFSRRIYTLMPSTRPYSFRDFEDIAEHGAALLETVRDINAASHLVGDMTGSTLDDPLFELYKKLGCSISPVEKDADDYKMVAKYLEKTYEPVKSYGVSIENVFAVELSACPSHDEIKKLPNKVLLWCGTRSSNLLRYLHKGFLPAICFLPSPGCMFGKAIVCSDAAAEAARYGFTAVDRAEGFLVLAIASLGEQITELKAPPKESKSLEEKKLGVMGVGRKKTDESEHFTWKDDIKVPCGRLISSEHKDSVLEYNEYAVYDPQQVSIRFLVAVKFEEKNVEYDIGAAE